MGLVYLVIDNSASMAGTAIGAVNRGLLTLQRALAGAGEGLQVGLIRFSTDAEELTPPVEVERWSPPRLTAGGGTRLSRGLLLLEASLERHRGGEMPPLAFLLTDGRPEVGDPWREVASRLAGEGGPPRVLFVALGAGQGVDTEVLRALAGPRCWTLDVVKGPELEGLFGWMARVARGEIVGGDVPAPPAWRALPEVAPGLALVLPPARGVAEEQEVAPQGPPPAPRWERWGAELPEIEAEILDDEPPPPAASPWTEPGEVQAILLGERGELALVGPRWAAGWSAAGALSWSTSLPSRRAALGGLGELLALQQGGRIKVLRAGRELLTALCPRCEGLALSPDGETVAAAGGRAIRRWRLHDGQELPALASGEPPQAGLEFSPDGACLASIGADGTVTVWELPGGHPRWRQPGVWPARLRWSPDSGQLLVSSAATLSLREAATGALRWQAPAAGEAAPCFVGGGAGIAAARSGGGWGVLGAASGQEEAQLPTERPVTALVADRRGLGLAVLSGAEARVGLLDVRARRWRMVSRARWELPTGPEALRRWVDPARGGEG